MKIAMLFVMVLLSGCALLGDKAQIDHALSNLENCRRDYVGTVGGTVPATTLSVNIHCDPKVTLPAAPVPVTPAGQ